MAKSGERARGRGEGTIVGRPDGTFMGQVSLGTKIDPVTGNRVRVRQTVYGKTRSEVGKEIRKLLEAYGKGETTNPAKISLNEYLDRWIRDALTSTVRPVTLQSYAITLDVHARPFIGQFRLADLKPAHLQHLYSARLAAGKSRRTVQYLHSILHRALEQAVKWEMIPRNPAGAVDAPKPGRYEISVLMPDQIAQLARALEGDRIGALYYLAVATGCRRGELVALRWSDVDLERATIQINRTAEQIGTGDVIFTEPKTDKSRRLIPLPAEAVTLLKRHRVRLAEERIKIAEYYDDQDLVFPKRNGGPLVPGHVSQHFQIVLERARLPRIRLHDLRHTHATLLLAAGTNLKITSERLGHSTIALTGDTYSHILPTMQEAVVKTLDALLPPAEVAPKRGAKRAK